jgi:uncharacterized integral membrane protein
MAENPILHKDGLPTSTCRIGAYSKGEIINIYWNMSIELKNQKISPLKKDSLHYAGQSLDKKIDEALDSKIITPIMVVIILFILAALEWAKAYFNIPYMPWVYTATAIIFAVYYGIKIRLSVKDIRNMQLGRDGERIVAESLEELRAAGYNVYHDIVGKSFNIDHIIVGSAGVFTIETKTYRKKVWNNSQISYDGNKIEIDGQELFSNPIKQAKGQMYWLEGFIKDNAKIDVKVQPVVVFPGWYINQTSRDPEVWILNDKALVTIMKKAEPVLDKNQIDLISSHIENYCRKN